MTDQVPPGGEASSLLDEPRLRFFLERQEQIRDWAAIATEVQDAVTEVLRELRVDLVDDPRLVELDIRINPRVNGEVATGPVLSRAEWSTRDDGLPDVGIALGWDGRVDPAGIWPRTVRPYVGVLTSHASDFGKAIEAVLRPLAGPHINDEPKFYKGAVWIVYRPLTADKDWWRDIPAWRALLVDELFAAWRRWAYLIDEAVSAAR